MDEWDERDWIGMIGVTIDFSSLDWLAMHESSTLFCVVLVIAVSGGVGLMCESFEFLWIN